MDLHNRILKRAGHVALPFKDKMLVWGGYWEGDEQSRTDDYCGYHNPDELWVYSTSTEVWSRCLTKGDIPPRCSGSCGVICGGFLYIFAGYRMAVRNMELGNSNFLFRLDLFSRTWQQLHPSGQLPSPCDKLVGWAFNDKLYFFGGFGPTPMGPVSFKFVIDPATADYNWPGRCWNNQLVCYNIKENIWEWPTTHGAKPAPRAAHACDISGSTVFIFGGRLNSVRNNELHSLNMHTMTWSGDLMRETSNPTAWPSGRSWHSLTFISPNTAILYGGLSHHNKVLSDCWRLRVKDGGSVEWNKVHDGVNVKSKWIPLLWHKSSYIPQTDEIYIIGGFTKSIVSDFVTTHVSRWDHADSLLIISFSPKSLLRICLDFIVDNDYLLHEESDYGLSKETRLPLPISKLLPNTLKEILKLRIQQTCFTGFNSME